MNFLYFKYLKNLVNASATSTVAGGAILSLTSIQPAQAAQIDFSFDADADNSNPNIVNSWNNGALDNDGWLSGQTGGNAIDPVTGLEVTFTGGVFEGTASTTSQNFNYDARNLTTPGLKVENRNDSDFNNTVMTQSGNDRTLTGGTLVNYQYLVFQFSDPINITSDTKFFIDDIDDDDRSGTNDRYLEAIAVEGFTTFTPGTPGTGIDPTFSYESGTELAESTINFGNSNNINYVYDSVDSDNNPANQAPNRAYYEFGSQEIQSVGLYFFTGSDTTNTGGHASVFGGSFSVEEAFPFEFSSSLGLLLSGASLFGVNYFRKKRVPSK